MANFLITIQDKTNLPPNQIGNIQKTIDYNTVHTFTYDNFITETNPLYNDPEGDEPYKLKIVDYPNSSHQIQLNGIEISEDDEILFTDIVNGNLTFVFDNSIITRDGYTFKFKISDEGSEQFSTGIGTCQMNVRPKKNEPPTEVGDGDETVDELDALVFTEAMFTATTPAYSDPESDPPGKLKIVSLPTKGTIYLNNIPVQTNQIIDFTDINTGKLVFISDEINQNELDNFEFQIADTGSNIFVG